MLMSSVTLAQKITVKQSQIPGWQKEWKQVDSLSDIGLPKSAMVVVDRIYSASKSGKDLPQFIKAVIYKIKLNSYFRQDFLEGTIGDLEKEIKLSGEPSKQILQSILAEVYNKYYQNNRYRFQDRTRIAGVKADSLPSWDENTITSVIYQNYLASLQNEKLLKSISILDYKAIIEVPESGFNDKKSPRADFEKAMVLRPALYDFLAHRALDFFTSTSGPAHISAFGFHMDNPAFFSPTDEFTRISLPVSDSLSQDLQAVKFFQKIVSFHQNDKNPEALIDAELARFAFVKDKAVTANNDSLYLDALKKLENRFKDSPCSAGISFAIAKFYQEQGSSREKDSRYKYDLKQALEICASSIKRFPASDGAKNCSILADEIRNREVEIKNEAVVSPGNPSLALISYKNLVKVNLRLIKVDQVIWETKKEKQREELTSYLASLKPFKTWGQALPDFGDFRNHSLEIMLEGCNPGIYVILACSDSSFSNSAKLLTHSDFTVSSINYISRRNKNGRISLYIFNRYNGLAIPGIIVETWEKNYNYRSRDWETRKTGTLISDSSGFATIPAPVSGAKINNLYCKLIYAEDVLVTSNFYQYPVTPVNERAVKQTAFFTDRAIYRPGQTVYFKGLLMEKKGEQTRLLCGEATTVILTDVNSRRISEQVFKTNEFGSFNGSFIAPSDVLPGGMRIYNESGSISFSVEQYKRPTFELSFDPLEGNYKLNETLAVKGKAMAYAGNAISQATVKYRVVRRARFPWWQRWYIPFPSSPEVEIANGKAKTAEDGSFSFSFTALPDLSIPRSSLPVFDFSIKADVTDMNGETQSLEQAVSVGYKSLLLSVNVPAKLNLQNDSLVKFRACNLNGRSTPVKLSVSMYKLRIPSRAFLKRSWEIPDTCLIAEHTFHESFPGFSYGNEGDTSTWKPSWEIVNTVLNLASDSVINIRQYSENAGGPHHIGPGVYQINMSADDPFGEKVSLKRFFTVYDPASAELPGTPANWFVPLKTSAKPGETASFLIGSGEKNVNVMYEIFAGDSLVSRKWIKLGSNQMRIDIPVTENYRGNFFVNFVFSKFNRTFQNSQLVKVPFPDNKLNIAIESFRSKILPGQKEQWKIRISTADKKPAVAEFLASMYDASLDAFRANDFAFDIARRFFGANPWNTGGDYLTCSGSASGILASGSYTEPQYPQLNWFGINYFVSGPYPMMLKAGRPNRGGLAGGKADMMVAQDVNPGETAPPETEAVTALEVVKEEKPAASPEKPDFQLRRDFRETAFFYPCLVTDSTGEISLGFTAPDALTRWKFQGFAHTHQLEYNLLEKELVTQKDLMVMPNAPRFVRQGDILVFSSRVVNLSDQELKAVVHIELLNGLSMKPLDSLVEGAVKQEIVLPKGGSAAVSWNIRIPDDPSLSLLEYRIIAQSGTFSDGEEKLIPVLPNRIMVTESLPLPVRDKGSFDFNFDKLRSSSAEKTIKNYRLTLEFASNPAWYAVQALPALNEKQYEDACSTFGAFYSNSIAAWIMGSDPKIKAVFESWKSLTPNALLSNLEKNSQLKSLLLQQTPWVAEAKTETGNRLKLGLYFDPDNLKMNLQKNLSRLQKLQTADGGFTWFEGMPESRFISQEIIGGLAHLEHLGVPVTGGDPQLKQMLVKGVQYMDEAFMKNYEDMKRFKASQMKDNNLGTLEIQYLYARSYFLADEPIPVNLKEALGYFLQQSGQYWTKQDLSSQAMIALALDRFGKKDISSLIIKSLSERALHSPELGMYWAQAGGYYWQQAPVETQALLIEAYDEVAGDSKAVDEMKIWLLKQKQTQSWTSSRATAEACYALLLRGTNLLSEDPKIIITLGKIKIDPSQHTDVTREAGTGYFSMSWSGNEITPDMGVVRVSKSGTGVAWGALYWQYFENLDRITSAQTSLKLEKKLFIEKNTPSGPVLELVKDKANLKTGDKLKVRIVLSTDRALEFVHMGDQRASAFEPMSATLSAYHYQDGLGYYQSTTDASTDFFFDYVPRGTYVFEYPLLVNAAGEYANGITSIQCMYAPEFSAHSEGIRVIVTK
jgi:hypothetical protein